MKVTKTTGLNIYYVMSKLYAKRDKLKKAMEQVGKEIGAGSDAFLLLKEQLLEVEKEVALKETFVYYIEPQEQKPQDNYPLAPAGYLNK